MKELYAAFSGRHRSNPVEHASYGEKRTRTGLTVKALCGAGVYVGGPPSRFNPTNPRACKECSRMAKP